MKTKIEWYANLTGTPNVIWKLVEPKEHWYEEALDTKDQDEFGELTVGIKIETITELVDLLSAIKELKTFDQLNQLYVGCSILKDNIRAEISLGTLRSHATGDVYIYKEGQDVVLRQAYELLGKVLGV